MPNHILFLLCTLGAQTLNAAARAQLLPDQWIARIDS